MTHGLTPRTAQCLRFIRRHIAEHGHSPSYDQIAHGLGLGSKSGVARMVRELVERGYITILPGQARSMALVASADPYSREALMRLTRAQLSDIILAAGRLLDAQRAAA